MRCHGNQSILSLTLIAASLWLLSTCAFAQEIEPTDRFFDHSLARRVESTEAELAELRRQLSALRIDRPGQDVDDPGVAKIGDFDNLELDSTRLQTVEPVGFIRSRWQQGGNTNGLLPTDGMPGINSVLTNQRFEGEEPNDSIGGRFYRSPDFDEGIIIEGIGAAMKIGGFVKGDLIHDFDPIDSTDAFNPTMIPIGAPPRENTRFHARTSRLSFDTRWPTEMGTARAYVEGDFFSDGNRFRLRHAYGELRNFIVGQTWTTFTDSRSLPQTLDFEGPVSGVSRRQAQVRWTESVFMEELRLAIALENPQVIVELPETVAGEPRTESPDFVTHLRYVTDDVQLQVAGVVRELGFQPVGERVRSETAWGLNFTGYVQPTDDDAAYYQILFGDGIGSYRDLPDVAPSGPNSAILLPTFGWLVGYKHNWTEMLTSNVTYSQSRSDTTDFQSPDSLRETTYLAVNLIWNPTERVFTGIEYLFGTRENIDGSRGEAHRIQTSFGFFLP